MKTAALLVMVYAGTWQHFSTPWRWCAPGCGVCCEVFGCAKVIHGRREYEI